VNTPSSKGVPSGPLQKMSDNFCVIAWKNNLMCNNLAILQAYMIKASHSKKFSSLTGPKNKQAYN
jgi:hypothetical protein